MGYPWSDADCERIIWMRVDVHRNHTRTAPWKAKIIEREIVNKTGHNLSFPTSIYFFRILSLMQIWLISLLQKGKSLPD